MHLKFNRFLAGCIIIPVQAILFLILASINNSAIAYKDSVDYSISHFTDENGLPQNSVKSIVADVNGFIWLTTEDGLVRYDGRNFVVFDNKKLKLKSGRMVSFFSKEGNLYCYNVEREFLVIKNGIPSLDTTVTSEWQVGECLYINAINPQLFAHTGLPSEPERWSENPISQWFILGLGEKYIFKNDSISYVKDGRQQYKSHFATKRPWSFFRIESLLFHLEGETLTTFLPDRIEKKSIRKLLQNITSAKENAEIKIFWNVCSKDFVLLYVNQSFFVLRLEDSGNVSIKRIFSGVKEMTADIKSAFYNEVSGDLYLGGYTGGMYILKKKHFSTLTNEKVTNVYYGLIEYGANNILTAQGVMFNDSGGSHLISAINKRVYYDYFSIAVDSLSQIYVKMADSLFQFSATTLNQKAYWKMPFIIGNLLYKNNRLWIASRGSTLYSMDTRQKNPNPKFFCDVPEPITCMAQEDGILYVGTKGHLYKISLRTKVLIKVSGMEGHHVSSINILKDKSVWITTHGNGFYLLRNERLLAMPMDERGYLATCHYVVEDNNGFFWIPTNKGLFQILKADLYSYIEGGREQIYYHYYDKKEGFNTNEFNGNAMPGGITLQNGKIAFPSLNGVVTFYPESIKPELPSASLFVNQVQVDKKEVSLQQLLLVPHRFNQIKLQFATPYMGPAENLNIAYALVRLGELPNWIKMPQDGSISINTLPSGEYELHVRKLNGFGANSATLMKVPIVIANAWYEELWFYGLCLALLAISVGLFIKFRVRFIKRRNKQLEAIVAEKTQALQRQTNIQDKILRSISHDVQTPLQYQVLLAQSISDSLLRKDYEQTLAPAKVLNDGMIRLHQMITNLLEYLKTQKMSVSNYRSEKVDVHAIAEEKLELFKAVNSSKGNVVVNHVLHDVLIEADWQMLSIILHNLLDNSVKATKNGRIEIGALCAGNDCRITVKDSGKGLPKHLQQWINATDNSQSVPESGNDYAIGIGLLLVKDLVKLMNMTLSVEAEDGIGTCFTIVCKVAN